MSNLINGTDMTNPEHKTITTTAVVREDNTIVFRGAQKEGEWIESNICVAREDAGETTDEAYAWVFDDE
jgi:hypothetical protein